MSVHQRFLYDSAFPGSILWKTEKVRERAAGVEDPDVIRERDPALYSHAAQNERNQDVIIVVGTMRPLVSTVIADNTDRRILQPASGLPCIQNTCNAAIRTRDGIEVRL